MKVGVTNARRRLYRAIGVRTSRETILYSRNHKNFNKRFPQIAEALREFPPDTVIDGEVVALDESGRPDFHRLQQTYIVD